MKARKGWILTCERVPPGDVTPEQLAVIVPSRKMTNRAVDDLVREHYQHKFGGVWLSTATWHEEGDALVLRLGPTVRYRLTPAEIYG